MPEVWPWPPLAAMTETLSFLTDVRRAGASEARTSLRDARIRLEFEHLLDDAANQEAAERFMWNTDGAWLVPAWAEGTEFAAQVAAGATELAVHLFADWRVGDQAFVWNAAAWETIEVTAINSASISLATPTTIACDFAAPLRTCYAAGPLGGARWWRGMSRRAIAFVSQDGDDIGASDFATAGGYPVIEDAPAIVSPLDQVTEALREYVDNGTGPVAVEPLRDVFDRRHAISFIDAGAEAIWRRKAMMHHLRGRDAAFWLPSWADDLSLAAAIPAAQAFLDVAAAGIDPATLVDRWLAIEDSAGVLYRQVTDAVELSGGTWRLTIAAPGRDIAAARLSLMTLMRLDTDEIRFSYVQRLIARTSAICLEVGQ